MLLVTAELLRVYIYIYMYIEFIQYILYIQNFDVNGLTKLKKLDFIYKTYVIC